LTPEERGALARMNTDLVRTARPSPAA
jgi:hypothetical protein